MFRANERQPKNEEAPALRARASSVKTFDGNHDMNSSTATSNVIPFRSTKLLLVDFGGQPFVAMKPVVEGMGLAWQTQHRKLMAGRFASVITMMVTTGFDGKKYEMACLPLRKLAGWLMSIHASKVRPECREDVIAYQNECDDALWDYWNSGYVINHRGSGHALTVLGQTIGTDGFHMLGALIKGKVSSLPAAVQRRATAKIWSQAHAAFGVRSAADIPADQLDSARNFIAAYAIEGEWLPKQDAQPSKLNIHQPLDVLTSRREGMLTPYSAKQGWLDIGLDDVAGRYRSPCEAILCELSAAGYDVEGAWWEVRTYRNKISSILSAVKGLNISADRPHRYVIAL